VCGVCGAAAEVHVVGTLRADWSPSSSRAPASLARQVASFSKDRHSACHGRYEMYETCSCAASRHCHGSAVFRICSPVQLLPTMVLQECKWQQRATALYTRSARLIPAVRVSYSHSCSMRSSKRSGLEPFWPLKQQSWKSREVVPASLQACRPMCSLLNTSRDARVVVSLPKCVDCLVCVHVLCIVHPGQ
jgi:hypothetical protein